MKSFQEFRELSEAKRGLYANIHAKKKRGLLKKNLNSHKKEQPGQKSQAKVSQEDLTQKDADLMKRKIQDLTLKHQARRLEIPGGHPSALE
jgi:hypothetical protein